MKHRGHARQELEREVRSKKERFQAEEFFGKPDYVHERLPLDYIRSDIEVLWSSEIKSTGSCRALFYEFDTIYGGPFVRYNRQVAFIYNSKSELLVFGFAMG